MISASVFRATNSLHSRYLFSVFICIYFQTHLPLMLCWMEDHWILSRISLWILTSNLTVPYEGGWLLTLQVRLVCSAFIPFFRFALAVLHVPLIIPLSCWVYYLILKQICLILITHPLDNYVKNVNSRPYKLPEECPASWVSHCPQHLIKVIVNILVVDLFASVYKFHTCCLLFFADGDAPLPFTILVSSNGHRRELFSNTSLPAVLANFIYYFFSMHQ